MTGSSKRNAANGKNWTKTEDERLRAIMLQGTPQSWQEIALDAFPEGKHDHTACLDRWKVLSKPKSHKGPWTLAEDAALTALVAEDGPDKWVQIAAKLNTRSGKQCRERWHNHLDPSSGSWRLPFRSV
jgi:myb proto-oncogene protein